MPKYVYQAIRTEPGGERLIRAEADAESAEALRVKLEREGLQVSGVVEASEIPPEQGGPFRISSASDTPLEELVSRASELGVVQIADAMIEQGVREGASDIHVEPRARCGVVRCRVDGVLHQAARLPRELTLSLVARIKLMAGLDVNERFASQVGSFRARVAVPGGSRDYVLRAATLSSIWGESLVLRVQEPAMLQSAWTWEKVGLTQTAEMSALLARPHGLILFAGPTGSGKTTVMCTALNSLDREKLNVVMIGDEDIRISGVNLSRPGMPVADAVRALVQRDPDVIAIMELRRREDADAALDAAVQGHLVLACLHADDAVGGVERLLALGIPPEQLAAGLAGVVASRLVRRVCGECGREDAPDEAALRALGISPGEARETGRTLKVRPYRRGAGCEECRGTGYRGRTGIFEVLPVDQAVARLLMSGAVLRRGLTELGLRGFRDDAAQKVRAGITTAAEALRVTSDLEVIP